MLLWLATNWAPLDGEFRVIILTDSPQWILDIPMLSNGCSGTWTDTGRGIPDPFEQELWRELGTGDRLWRGRAAVHGPQGFWDILLVVRDATRSQFDVLKDMSSAPGEWPANVACVAHTGRGFHGHRGRFWHTERGNLHLSTACRLDLDAATCGLAMTALPAVAVINALIAHGDWTTAPGIKWVNDILMTGRKVGGVLTATQSLGQTLTSLTLGIGLNVGQVPAGFIPDLFVPATGCLADFAEGRAAPTVGRFLEIILGELADSLARVKAVGCEPLLSEYRKHSLVIGRRVKIVEDLTVTDKEPGLLAEGKVTAIGSDLSLTIEGHQGPVSRGRLVFWES